MDQHGHPLCSPAAAGLAPKTRRDCALLGARLYGGAALAGGLLVWGLSWVVPLTGFTISMSNGLRILLLSVPLLWVIGFAMGAQIYSYAMRPGGVGDRVSVFMGLSSLAFFGGLVVLFAVIVYFWHDHWTPAAAWLYFLPFVLAALLQWQQRFVLRRGGLRGTACREWVYLGLAALAALAACAREFNRPVGAWDEVAGTYLMSSALLVLWAADAWLLRTVGRWLREGRLAPWRPMRIQFSLQALLLFVLAFGACMFVLFDTYKAFRS